MLAMVVRERPVGIPLGNIQLPGPLQQYACRMRLWNAIDRPAPMEINEHDAAGRFVPLEPLRVRAETIVSAQKVAEMARLYGADDQTINSLEISLAETMENCFAHSGRPSNLYGVACGQSWRNGNLAQIALVDRGMGVRDSLSENLSLANRLMHENSCQLATEFGVTGKPGKGHAGYGLALTRQLMEQAGGRLFVFSGNEMFVSADAVTTTSTTPTTWNGTVVVLEWRINRPLNVGDVYAKWPLPEGYTDDDFFDF